MKLYHQVPDNLTDRAGRLPDRHTRQACSQVRVLKVNVRLQGDHGDSRRWSVGLGRHYSASLSTWCHRYLSKTGVSPRIPGQMKPSGQTRRGESQRARTGLGQDVTIEASRRAGGQLGLSAPEMVHRPWGGSGRCTGKPVRLPFKKLGEGSRSPPASPTHVSSLSFSKRSRGQERWIPPSPPRYELGKMMEAYDTFERSAETHASEAATRPYSLEPEGCSANLISVFRFATTLKRENP